MNENYLKDCFDTETEEFKKMMCIVNENVDFPKKKCNGRNLHHIIPVCFFELKGLEVDNSESNLVSLDEKTHKEVHFLAGVCAKDFEVKNNMYVAAGVYDEVWNKTHLEYYKKEMERCSCRLMQMFNPSMDMRVSNRHHPVWKKNIELKDDMVYWPGPFGKERAYLIEAWKAVYGDSLKFGF